MSIEMIFRLLALCLVVIALSISGYFRRKADRQGGRLDTSTGQGLLVILRLLSLIVALPFLGYIVNPDWVTWARLPLPEWLRWLGAIVGIAALPLFFWIFTSIGQNISPTQATRQGHGLVTHGPYRWIRHPLYSVGTVFLLSLFLLSAVWFLAIGFLLILFLLVYRTPREEAALIAVFGDQYRAYMQRTGRYWPRLRNG